MVMSLSRVLWKVRSKAPTVTASVQGTVSVTGEGYTTIRDSTLVRCHRRVQQDLHGHRGRTGDPLYSARRTLHAGTGLLTDKQRARLEATWGTCQRMISAYREPDEARGKELMAGVHRVRRR